MKCEKQSKIKQDFSQVQLKLNAAGNQESGESFCDSMLFFPKALNITLLGRSSDLSRF
jgi:hypothetical protein